MALKITGHLPFECASVLVLAGIGYLTAKATQVVYDALFAAPVSPKAPSVKRQYQFIRTFQEGENSSVCLVKRMSDGVEFVSKEIYHPDEPAEPIQADETIKPPALGDTKQLIREVLVLQKLKHPNIPKINVLIRSENCTAMLTKYRPQLIDLYYFREQNQLSKDLVMKIFGQLVMTLKYCHDRNIIHRDIKLENILIDQKTHQIQLIDFGLARHLPTQDRPVSTPCGTLQYKSPEILDDTLYDGKKNDIWALGVALYTMVVGERPFEDKNRDALIHKIKKGDYAIPDAVDVQMKDLMRGILNKDLSTRFSLDQIIQHPLCQTYRQHFVDFAPRFDLPHRTRPHPKSLKESFKPFIYENVGRNETEAITGQTEIPLYYESVGHF